MQFELIKASKFLSTLKQKNTVIAYFGIYMTVAFIQVTINRALTPPCRMMMDVLDPRVERIPAISTAIYPAPTMTLRLGGYSDRLFYNKLRKHNNISRNWQSITYLGQDSSSKNPSLVMPKLAPAIILKFTTCRCCQKSDKNKLNHFKG